MLVNIPTGETPQYSNFFNIKLMRISEYRCQSDRNWEWIAVALHCDPMTETIAQTKHSGAYSVVVQKGVRGQGRRPILHFVITYENKQSPMETSQKPIYSSLSDILQQFWTALWNKIHELTFLEESIFWQCIHACPISFPPTGLIIYNINLFKFNMQSRLKKRL